MFQLVDQLVFFPARTLLGDSIGPAVDTGIELDPASAGRIYLGHNEVREAANLFGFVDPKRHAEVLSMYETVKHRVYELEGELKEARAQQHRVVSLEDARKLLHVEKPHDAATKRSRKGATT